MVQEFDGPPEDVKERLYTSLGDLDGRLCDQIFFRLVPDDDQPTASSSTDLTRRTCGLFGASGSEVSEVSRKAYDPRLDGTQRRVLLNRLNAIIARETSRKHRAALATQTDALPAEQRARIAYNRARAMDQRRSRGLYVPPLPTGWPLIEFPFRCRGCPPAPRVSLLSSAEQTPSG